MVYLIGFYRWDRNKKSAHYWSTPKVLDCQEHHHIWTLPTQSQACQNLQQSNTLLVFSDLLIKPNYQVRLLSFCFFFSVAQYCKKYGKPKYQTKHCNIRIMASKLQHFFLNNFLHAKVFNAWYLNRMILVSMTIAARGDLVLPLQRGKFIRNFYFVQKKISNVYWASIWFVKRQERHVRPFFL